MGASTTAAAAHRALGPNPVLDIGGDVGALLVHLAASPATGELHACPVGDPDARFHTGVHRWMVDEALTFVALFPEVHEGEYHLLDDAGTPTTRVPIIGGRVVELDLR